MSHWSFVPIVNDLSTCKGSFIEYHNSINDYSRVIHISRFNNINVAYDYMDSIPFPFRKA